MALTQDQWFKKIKSLVQSWVTVDSKAAAMLKGLAKTLETQQNVLDQNIIETFIDTGSDDYVAQHGIERSVTRIDNETLASYRERVKAIINRSNLASIKNIIDSMLIRGESTIIENYKGQSFFDRDSFLDRKVVEMNFLYNAFTVIVDYQAETGEDSSEELFSNIANATNKEIAFGIFYRLIERQNRL